MKSFMGTGSANALQEGDVVTLKFSARKSAATGRDMAITVGVGADQPEAAVAAGYH